MVTFEFKINVLFNVNCELTIDLFRYLRPIFKVYFNKDVFTLKIAD